jgi:hypothetical protein
MEYGHGMPTDTAPPVPNAVCPVCGRPSVEDFDNDGTSYNHCTAADGCRAAYVTPNGLKGPTMVLPLYEDQADQDAWTAANDQS